MTNGTTAAERLQQALDQLAIRPLRNAVGAVVAALADPGGNLRATSPAGRLVVAPGMIISSAWGNTVYDQSVMRFANAGDRDNQYPDPDNGAVVFMVDSQTHLRRVNNAWVPFNQFPLVPTQANYTIQSGTAAIALAWSITYAPWANRTIYFVGVPYIGASIRHLLSSGATAGPPAAGPLGGVTLNPVVVTIAGTNASAAQAGQLAGAAFASTAVVSRAAAPDPALAEMDWNVAHFEAHTLGWWDEAGAYTEAPEGTDQTEYDIQVG